MKGIALALASVTLLSISAASTSSAAEQENRSMDNATRSRIVTAATATAAGRRANWQAGDDVVVDTDPALGLDRGGCIFMIAINKTPARDRILLWSALLPDGRIAGVDITGNAAAATVLRLCGQDADANWWAHVIAHFSEAEGVEPVFVDYANEFADLVKAGLVVKAPTLTRSEGATTVEFFASLAEIEPLHVKATLLDLGDLTVIVEKLYPR